MSAEPTPSSDRDAGPSAPAGAGRRTARLSPIGVGLTVTVAWVVAAAFLLPAYGPTMDCASGVYALGEGILRYLISGEAVFLEHPYVPGLDVREPHPDVRGDYHWYQDFPFATTLSALSCWVLWTTLGVVPALFAHHVPIVLLVAILLGVLAAFIGRRLGVWTGVAAALFLVLSPRFFAHSFNNLKDVPETCLYSFALIAGWAAITTGRLRWWAASGALTGLALAQKMNALFVPVQLGAFLVACWILPRTRRPQPLPAPLRGIALAALALVTAYFLASPTLWQDPIARLGAHFGETLRVGNLAFSAGDEAKGLGFTWDAPIHVLITTPPGILVLALIGALTPGYDLRLRAFFVLWLVTPIARSTLPGMRNYDGVRHFLEFCPALAALAAIGLRGVVRWVTARIRGAIDPSTAVVGARGAAAAVVGAVVVGAALLPPLLATIETHPNGICYFNRVVGGLRGAQAIAVPQATDYWGNAYWQGMAWLDEHAEPESGLIVPVATPVARCAAPVRLRDDLRLHSHLAGAPPPPSAPVVYVMYVTRPELYGPTVHALERGDRRPAYEIVVQGGVILRVHRFAADTAPRDAAWIVDLWRRETRARGAEMRLLQWMLQDRERRLPAVWPIVEQLDAVGLEESQRRLRAVLPDELHQTGADVLWLRSRER